MSRVACLIVLLLTLVAPAWCETLGDAPLPLTVRVLDNGLTVAVVENHSVPVVTVEAAVKSGSMNEPPNWNGLSHLWEHMFFKGNARIPDQEAYLRRTRELGMVWNGTTNTERVNYFFTLPSDRLKAGLQFMSDALRSPRFDAAEFEREKEVVLGEFDRNEASPGYHLHHTVARALWGDLASRKDPLGTRQSIRAATREDMMQMQRLYYVPENTLLVIAGDVTPSRAFPMAQQVFGDWRRTGDAPATGVVFPPLKCSRVVRVTQPVQTVALTLNWIGPDTSTDRPGTLAADVFTFIVSQTESRLQKALVDSGLAESVSLGYLTQKRGGSIGLSIVTDRARARRALQAALKEVAQFGSPGYYTADQLQNARTLLAVHDLYSREVAHEFSHVVSFWWASADLAYYRDYVESIQAVTPQDLKTVVDRYLVGRPLVLGVMGNPEAMGTPDLSQASLEAELAAAGLEVCK